MLVGYMRVSSDGDRQVLDLQRHALLATGVDERHLFEDRTSGSRAIVSASRRLWSFCVRVTA
jgi:DNA invertase Pin-like site-specific DNA recombinase